LTETTWEKPALKLTLSLIIIIIITSFLALPAEAGEDLEHKAGEMLAPLAQTMDNVNILTEFYREQDYELIWLEENDLSALGSDLYSLLTRTENRGLVMDDYHLGEINGIWMSLRQQDAEDIDPSLLARLELKMTEGFFLMAADLASGQLEQENLERRNIPSRLKSELRETLARIISEGDFYPALEEIQPQHPHYWQLKEELKSREENNGQSSYIEDIIVNLERWRWLPRELGDPHILTNQPSFYLELFSGGEVIMDMKTVVGMPERPTPDISSRLTHLVLSPRWYMPDSIATQDHLPHIQDDIDYLEQRNFRVYEHDGERYEEVDPEDVEWEGLSENNFPYYLWQDAGPANALGRVIFRFPNENQIYLHDTPDRHLFEETKRAYSSGCIRVEKPMELTYYLLQDQPAWDESRIQEKIDNRDETQVNLREPVDIHLTYFTVKPDPNSQGIAFYDDLYDRDPELKRALNL